MTKDYKPKGRLDCLMDELGIKLVPVWRRRKNAQSHARGTMKIIIREHGEYHLKITLMAIRGSALNRGQLWSETIGAISDCLAACPEWLERPTEFFAAVDKVNLEDMRRFCVNLRPWPVRVSMRPLIFREIKTTMDQGLKQDLFEGE